MSDTAPLTERFEASRPRLRSLAYRILGNIADSEDALQDAWLRISRVEASEVEKILNPEGWITTVVARTCLNKLRSRRTRREELGVLSLPDLVVTESDTGGPEQELLLAEQIGLALQVVLDALNPPERVAFVLHDLFSLPFAEIADLLGRSPEATRQLASRARRRVTSVGLDKGDSDPAAEREIVDAFFSASRTGDLDALLAVLHPDVVFRADGGATRSQATANIRGRTEVAKRAAAFAVSEAELHPVRVNGLAGVVVRMKHGPISIMAFTVAGKEITEIYALLDTDRIRNLLGASSPDARMN